MVDAVAEAAQVPADAVRRAVMMRGATGPVASAVLLADDPLAALAGFTLEVGRPVRPMLAQSASDIGAAFEKLGSGGAPADLCVDVKLDGIRIQVHRDGDDVLVVTRSLDDITARVPEIVEVVRALPTRRLVLDGEALAVGDDGVPRPFQETAARSATRESGGGPGGASARGASAEAELAARLRLTPFFFDVLHADGQDLVDARCATGSPSLTRWPRRTPCGAW
nr:hypothetical protein GCM10025730_17240 [Promicromonospora thailandica]